METSTTIIQIEREGETVILTPQHDLREIEYQQIEAESSSVLQLLEIAHVKNVIVDLCKTDYYGSTALGFFAKLWKRVKSRHGHMAMCNVSKHEQEILSMTKLDSLWTVCGSREEALASVQSEATV